MPPEDDRTYIRLHDGMPEHPKVEGLSDRAFRLLVTTWCWCSRYQTDGAVRKSSWARRGTAAARRELVDAGLVELNGSHVYMHDYLAHQRSAEEIATLKEAKRAGGKRGNHIRWHVARGRSDVDCEFCTEGSDQGSDLRSQNRRKRSPDTQADTDTEIPMETREGASGTHRASDGPPRCAQHQDTPGDPGPCRGCAATRESADRAERRRRRDATLARQQQAHDEAHARQLATAACSLCDDTGRGPAGQLCRHDPDALARAARGRAQIQPVLDAQRQRRQQRGEGR